MKKANRQAHAIRVAHRLRRFHNKQQLLRSVGADQFRFQQKYGSWKQQRNWIRPRVRPNQIARVKVPEVFCFIENPEESLGFIQAMERQLAQPYIEALHVDHKRCRLLGLGASAVMDTLLLEVREQRSKKKGWRLMLSGTHPDNFDVRVMLRATGILRSLGHPESELPEPVEMRIVTCPMLSGNPRKPELSAGRDNAGTKIVEYFQKCLRYHGVQLDETGLSRIADLVTEVLGNSEDHGGKWYAIGYYTQKTGSDVGTCHIVLFNRGATIYESMTGPDSSPEIRARVDALAQRHMSGGLLDRIKPKPWTTEALVTLYAMQQGVSSKLQERPSRGNGTVEVIQAFAKLAGVGGKMCILSGSAYIAFDDTYGLSELSVDGQTRLVMAFNKQNSLESPPDGDYVYGLKHRFQGTIVNLQFPLSKQHLQAMVEQNDQD